MGIDNARIRLNFQCRARLLPLFIAGFVTNLNATPGETIQVSSTVQLQSALSAATGGETIILASGSYESIDVNDRSYTSYVTIKSADRNGGAVLRNIEFKRSSYVRVDSVTINHSGREGVGIFEGSHHIQILNSEVYGQARFDRSNPSFEQVSSLYAVNAGGNVHDLLIENIDAHDVKSSAYLFSGVSDTIIRENKCDWVAADCFKLAGADGILFENNFGARNVHGAPNAHIDFVQGQGSVSNSVFRGNVALMGSDRGFQGLFFDDATFTNLRFEDNVISTSQIRGISVSSPSNGTPSTGIVARNNTVLIPGGKFKASLILLPENSISEDNIVSNSTTKNDKRIGKNITAQWDDDDDLAHYDDYYVNADRGIGATIEDFRPVAGSVAENQKGAYRRILELLNGTSTPPAPPPAVPPTSSNAMAYMPAVMMLLVDDK